MNTTDRGPPTNRKKLLLPTTMSKAGWAIVEARDDVEGVPFAPTVPKAELHRLLEDIAGVALGVQPFSDPGARRRTRARSRLAHRRRLRRGRRPGADRAKNPVDDRRHCQFGQRRRSRVVSDHVVGPPWCGDGPAGQGRPLAGPLQGDAGRSLRQDRVDHRLRQDRHARGQALCRDGDECAGLRPVHLFRDDPRHGL